MEEVSKEIQRQLQLLINNLPECEEKTKTIMKILISKYKEITDIGCREVLCDLVLSDVKLIKISNEFFIHILDSFSFTPDSLEFEDDSQNPFSKSAENNKLLKKINGKNISKILRENLKYIFKFKILQYYKEKLNTNFDNDEEKIREEIDEYLGEDSFKYFKNAHNTIIEIINSEEVDIPNKNIKEIFCIVYSCIFLENFVKYTITHNTLVSGRKAEIISFLNEGTSKIKETFKLFILKELKTKYITERTEFLNIQKWTDEYNLKDLFKDLKFEKSNSKEIQGSLANLFYGGYTIEELNNEKVIRNFILYKYHDLNERTFLCNIDIFINENLSTLKTEEGLDLCKNSNLMKLFNSYINREQKFSSSTKKLVNLFFDNQIYIEKLSKIINDTNYFEILLYSYRLTLICSMANQNSIFSKMIKENCSQEINKYYIPGADLYCDLWVESYLNMIDSITKNGDGGYSNGYYICDCGEYYFQQPCGVPIDISFCANCGKEIGGNDEILVKRKEDNGQYKIMRIYSSQNNKNNVQARGDLQSRYGADFENGYPNKLFSEFEVEMKDKMNSNYKGILEQNYLLFINETKKIRNLNQISYRILNFIIYSNIYFSYKCKFISLEEINSNKYIPRKEEPYKGNYSDEDSYNDYRARLLSERKEGIKDENNILELLNINWVLLDKYLKEKGVESIQIFLNSIFGDLYDIIVSSGEMSTTEERNQFENNINELIERAINNYRNNSEEYHKNVEQIMSQNLEINYIILERNSIMKNADIIYPYYYEYLSIPLIEENQLIERLKSIENSKSQYPVLCAYLDSDKKEIDYLQTFTQINNFVNYTIEHYTNQISREKAKSVKIKDEIAAKNIPSDLLNDFLKGFNDSGIYKIAFRYECHDLRERFDLRELTKEDDLSCFLIDNGVQYYGMQIASIYQKYISFQNSFLDKVFYNIPDDNIKLVYLKKKLSETINPQKANKYNLVSFDISTENYESFLEMILFYSYRDSFDENFNFDYSKKDRIKYNLEEIEEQLEYLLLPGKKKFTDKIEYVVYQFEGFRSQNSSILSTFIINYPQKNLSEKQKEKLYNFRSEQYSTESITKILFSIQLMITFYNEQPVYTDKNIRISDTISDFPSYFKIPDDTRNLFRENPFTISQILSVYEYFELLCFSEFKNNIDPSYKQIIDDEKSALIEKYFAEHTNVLLTKLQISTAVRKFISRSLVGTREDLEVRSEQKLFDILQSKEDCWNIEIVSRECFEKEIEELKKLNIVVGQILSFYEKLGGDTSLLGEVVQKQVKKNEEEENNKQTKKAKDSKKKKTKKQVF